jgi:hypothetical protein
MKLQFSLLTAVLILFSKLATAQIYPPEPGDFKVTASFDFVVQRQSLPSGNYIVHRDKASNRLQICEDGVICETVETAAVQALETPTQPKLVFSRYGSRHVLCQIWFSDGTGLQVLKSFLDSEVASREVKHEAVEVVGDLLCIHANKGMSPSWH